jgi:dihydrodipicolinate synthase/N-acetylneuraminate lyase
MSRRLYGAIAAAVTPLSAGGRTVDTAAIGTLTSFLARGGVAGLLACGTTGEGMLLSVVERRAVTDAFVAARPAGLDVAVHVGAQTTADTVTLAAHARETGADAVAVIAPPYFPLDDEELFRHLVSAANAADPTPCYLYEFVRRSGYAIPVDVVARVRSMAPNVVGLKVSDTPFDAVEPYLGLGLDVFIGNEPLALQGIANGAVGTVSGLATAFPEVVARLVADRDEEAHHAVNLLRDALKGIPFHAAMKEVLAHRDVPLSADVRPPLRGLTARERETVLDVAGEVIGRSH